MGTKKNGLELYLHIPFCIKKCDYCDFLSGPSTRAGQEAYIYALLREMETVSKNLKKRPELTGSALAYSRQTIRNWLCLEEFIIMHSFWKAFRWQERLAFPI